MSMLSRLFFAEFPVWDDPQACQYRRVRIDADACDGCKLCVVACPAGALELYGENGSKKVRVVEDARACISCNNCHAICVNEAIRAVQHFGMTGFYQTEGIGEMLPPRTSFADLEGIR